MPSRDQVSDRSGAELFRLSQRYEFPDFVKQASLDTVRPRELAITAYGDPRNKDFPCDTAASTWLSSLFFQEKRAEYHPKDQARIQSNIDSYAVYHKCKLAVDRMRGRWEELHKEAESRLPDSAYAYVMTLENGTKDRHLRITNTLETKAAADWLETYRDRIPYSDRRKIALRILEKAAQYGAGLGKQAEFIERQAGRGVCEPAEVVSMIKGRAQYAKNAIVSDGIIKLAQSVEKTPRQALHPDSLIKLAETMDQIDQGLGLIGRYAEGISRPEDVIFKATFSKVASDVQSVVATTSGRIYSKNDFKKLALDDVRDLYGSDFAEQVRSGLDVDPEKMAELVHTLPRPDAELLDTLMGDHGIQPVMHKAAAEQIRFTESQWAEMARAY
jgi:hypothetical protein